MVLSFFFAFLCCGYRERSLDIPVVLAPPPPREFGPIRFFCRGCIFLLRLRRRCVNTYCTVSLSVGIFEMTDTFSFQTEIRAEHDSSLVLGHWDPRTQTVAELIEILNEVPDDVSVGLADLPSLDMPETVADYPVWAVDYQNNALVGAGPFSVEPLADVIASYNPDE